MYIWHTCLKDWLCQRGATMVTVAIDGSAPGTRGPRARFCKTPGRSWRNLMALFKPFLPPLSAEFLSEPSFNPSERELGCEVTLKDFLYVNYSRPRSRAEVGAHHLQMGSAPSALCKSPSSGRCRFGLIKSYAEPVYLSLLRILGNSTFLPSLSS